MLQNYIMYIIHMYIDTLELPPRKSHPFIVFEPSDYYVSLRLHTTSIEKGKEKIVSSYKEKDVWFKMRMYLEKHPVSSWADREMWEQQIYMLIPLSTLLVFLAREFCLFILNMALTDFICWPFEPVQRGTVHLEDNIQLSGINMDERFPFITKLDVSTINVYSTFPGHTQFCRPLPHPPVISGKLKGPSLHTHPVYGS